MISVTKGVTVDYNNPRSLDYDINYDSIYIDYDILVTESKS